MKKLIITISVLATVGVGSSYGQGTLFFNNTGGTRVSTNSGASSGAVGAGLASPAAGSFYFALFYSTTQTAVSGNVANVAGTNGAYAFDAAGWTDASAGLTGPYGTNGAAGRFSASSLNSDGSYSVNGLAGGAAAAFTIVGWSANIGTTITALRSYMVLAGQGLAPQGGWVGQSAVSGLFNVGTLGSTPAATIMGAASPNIPGFVLGEVAGVPEPGTLALAALGGASLLMFRRKK